MLLRNKIAKNAFWIIGCRVVQSVLTLVINMLTARYLGPSNYGLISYAASIIAFFVPIMNLGINEILVNELVKNPEKEGEILGTSLSMTLISGFFCICGVIAFVSIANPYETVTIVVCALYSLVLIFQSLEIIQYWFQAKLLAKYTSLTVLFAYFVVSAYRVFLLITGKSIYWFAVANAFDYFIISVTLIIIYYIKNGDKFCFSLKTAKRLLEQGKYYIIANLMVAVCSQIDRVVIKAMSGNEEVGYYSAAFAICGMASFVFLAVIDSFRPIVLENKTKSEKDYEDSIVSLYSVVIYIAVFMSIVIFFFSKLIIYILYGESYYSANTILKIMVWYTVFSYFGAAKNVWILAENKQKYLVVINVLGAFVSISLNLLLVPLLKGEGAAIAAVITQFFVNIGMFCIIPDLRKSVKLLLKSLNPKIIIYMVKKLIV